MIAVLIADDHSIVRQGIRHFLESEGDIRVCGETGDGPELVEQVDKHRPDVLVLDVTSPHLAGLETLRAIHAEHPETRTVVLSSRVEWSFVQNALASGADGCLPQSAPREEIVAAIRAVVDGGSWLSPSVARGVVDSLRDARRSRPQALHQLSGRECQVLRLIAEGLSAKEVAVDLEISTKTVEAHRTSLMRKLGVRKATELVRCAVRFGLVEP